MEKVRFEGLKMRFARKSPKISKKSVKFQQNQGKIQKNQTFFKNQILGKIFPKLFAKNRGIFQTLFEGVRRAFCAFLYGFECYGDLGHAER